jgi:hypothetical protein
MTQKKISELFGVQRTAITKHLINIFDSGELPENSVSSILEHTTEDRKIYKISFIGHLQEKLLKKLHIRQPMLQKHTWD